MKKDWWKSKTIWAGIVIAAVGTLRALGYGDFIPMEIVYALASALGLVGIRQAIDN